MSSNEKVNMQKVFFAFGKSKLTTQGQTTLNFIAEQLQANPEAKIELLGHNNQMEDSVGVTNAYYADMDSKRIGTVMKYLMSKGIAESSIIPSMKGDSIKNEELLEEDDAELKMAKNRRVTFKFRD